MSSTAAPRADRGVRVLVAEDVDTVARELRRVGSEETGVRLMAPRGLQRLVRLEAVPARAAIILKQEMLAHGGDAAIHAEVIDGEATHSAVVLLGSLHQLDEVCGALQRYSHGLGTTGDAIRQALAHFVARRGALRCGPYTLPLGEKTYIMGILNVTPDSFSGDGLAAAGISAAQRQAERMLAEGADILDIGGESTRPGTDAVPLDEELRRVVPVVKALAPLGVPISVDTTKSAVASEALAAGATLINDISGLFFDPEMAAVVAAAGVPVVVMHMPGTPRTMQQHTGYDDLLTEVCTALQEATARAEAAGIPRDQVVLDPGFGFGKTVAHNLELLRRLRELTSYGQPLLLGTSRKSTIGKVLGDLPPQERVEGTIATTVLGIANGADIVRVHDIQANARAAKMADAIVRE